MKTIIHPAKHFHRCPALKLKYSLEYPDFNYVKGCYGCPPGVWLIAHSRAQSTHVWILPDYLQFILNDSEKRGSKLFANQILQVFNRNNLLPIH